MIGTVPQWARADVQGFLNSGQLPGGKREPLSQDQAALKEEDLSQQYDAFVAIDETEQDLASGEPGKVVYWINEDTKSTFLYEGDHDEGSSNEYAEFDNGVERVTVLEFGEDSVKAVAIWKNGSQNSAVAYFLDREEPTESYWELRRP